MSIFRELGVREGKDRVNEEVIYNIAKAYTVIDGVISGFLSKYDLSPAKFNILLMVKHVGKDKGISQNEISKLLLVTTSNITRMIDKLEKDKYVERISQKGDRRVNLIKITKKGSDLLDKVWPHYKEKIDKLIGNSFSGSEKKILNDSLCKIKNIIKEA
ncbi:MAG: MarR family transcriptional regulator [Candidatus Omnitrophica bacterium]|nr:MarR family transcriptional regulator [Candidatus Omnitrophota bacterium]